MTSTLWARTARTAATARTRTSRVGNRLGPAGFTLTELLVVFAVLGLTVAIAVPAFIQVQPGLELSATARGVAATLREARAMAIGENREVTVRFDLANRRFGIGGDGAGGSIDPAMAIALFTAQEEVVAENVGEIRFYPDGTSTGGRLRVARESRQYDVLVDWITGNVVIQK